MKGAEFLNNRQETFADASAAAPFADTSLPLPDLMC